VEHVNIARLKYRNLPRFKCILRDLEEDFADLGKFDLLIHFGLLYHVENVEQNLRNCAELSDEIVLETEVVDSLDDQRVVLCTEDADCFASALHGTGSRPSPFYIKRVFEELGYDVDIITDKRLNSGIDVYDWEHRNDGTWGHGKRRFFWIRRTREGSLY